MPVRTPGSTMTVSTLNHRSLISRSAVRSRGTTDATAMPVMVSAGSRPWSWNSWSMSSAISSAVARRHRGDAPVVEQLGAAAGRPVAGAVQADDGLGVADVDGDQHRIRLQVQADVEHRRGMGQGARPR